MRSFSDHGAGDPALLCMPGWCGSRASFDSIGSLLSAKHRVLAIDLAERDASGAPADDLGAAHVVDEALAVIAASGARTVVPVALSHAGWIAIELRRRLGDRVPGVVLLDWIVATPPPPFLGALERLQGEAWSDARDELLAMWLRGNDVPAVADYVRRDIGSATRAMWARAGREIGSAYAREKSPLAALGGLAVPVPTLHLYAQPEDPGYLEAQRAFAREHDWFHVTKLDARTHFPMIERPELVAPAIESFVASIAAPARDR